MAVNVGYGVPSPAIPTWTSGAWLLQSELNAVPALILDLYTQALGGWRTRKPIALVKATDPAGGIPDTTDTLLPFTTVVVDEDGMFSATSPTQLVVATPGWWRFVLFVHYDSAVNARHACKVLVNGSNPDTSAVATDGRESFGGGTGPTVWTNRIAHVSAGSAIFANTWQYSGGSTAHLVSTGCLTFLAAEWIAP